MTLIHHKFLILAPYSPELLILFCLRMNSLGWVISSLRFFYSQSFSSVFPEQGKTVPVFLARISNAFLTWLESSFCSLLPSLSVGAEGRILSSVLLILCYLFSLVHFRSRSPGTRFQADEELRWDSAPFTLRVPVLPGLVLSRTGVFAYLRAF